MSRKRAANPSEAFPNRKDADGRPLCAVCGKVLSGRARRYCSLKCREQCHVATMPSLARLRVHQRDHGICANCGCDTEKLARIIQLAGGDKWAGWRILSQDWQDVHNLTMEMGFTTLHFWEMDHIIPVSEGGGLCGLDNLRTLCVPCHRAETRALARRRAQRNLTTPLFAEATT